MITGFMLAAKPYEVEYTEHDSDNLGQAKNPLLKVQIQTKWAGKEVPEISQEQTLYHEVVHCILDEIGRSGLNSDEEFVQSFSNLMHQFVKTKVHAERA